MNSMTLMIAIGGVTSTVTLLLIGIIVHRAVATIRLLHQRRHEIVRKSSYPLTTEQLKNSGICKFIVILGSGGHTAEMLMLVSELLEQSTSNHNQVAMTYVTGATDHHSMIKVEEFYMKMKDENLQSSFVTLPRAREVGQSWISSIFTSLQTTMSAFKLVCKVKPDIILTNGPGTSAIVAGVAFFLRVTFPSTFRGYCRVIYVESFARVESLSLSGKLVYFFADRFLVQWEELRNKWPLAEYYGRVC